MTALGSAIAFTFVNSLLLNQLLSLVESLTLFLHICLIGLNYPSNIISFFQGFYPLVIFDPIPTDKLFEKIFKFSQVTSDEPLTYQYGSIGYASKLSVINLGSLFLVITIWPVFILLICWLRKIRFIKRCNIISSQLDKIHD